MDEESFLRLQEVLKKRFLVIVVIILALAID